MLLLYPGYTPGVYANLNIYIPLCFYFIHIGNYRLSRSLRIYIPLCFYFITCRQHNWYSAGYIYIPLCFYFIQKMYLHAFERMLHLHSTMLLLYPGRADQGDAGGVRFTFHYASTLSRHEYFRSTPENAIYIPLCFYFIPPPEEELEESAWYLHSTMLLLYLPAARFHLVLMLHLHSTMLLLYRVSGDAWVSGDAIYIPLCFYFIQAHPAQEVAEGHLHSTMLLLYLRPTKFLFFAMSHLHSTMLLLYPEEARDYDAVHSNLHSTMLLLYPETSLYEENIWRDLHSTMLLLYLKLLKGNMSCNQIYIPLCFYFICDRRWQGNAVVSFTFHYASTLS